AKEANERLDAALTFIQPTIQVPPALVPKWAMSLLANYLAYQISVESGVGPKLRASRARQINEALKRARPQMAEAFHRLYRGFLPEGTGAATAVIRDCGPAPEDADTITREKRK